MPTTTAASGFLIEAGIVSVSSSQNERFRRDVATLIFITLLGTYAYFWQARCWNSASRLMLTYAIGDRGGVSIDGLEQQTLDRAFARGHYYSDKAPGQSILGVPVYLVAKVTGIRHPLNQPTFPYWWPDYVLTVATSGVLTAGLGVAIYTIAFWLGCRQWSAAVTALSYGLGTPAFTYATLYYGHQTAGFCAVLSLLVLYRNVRNGEWSARSMFAAGLAAGYAVLTEYPLVFVSTGLAGYALYWCRRSCALLMFGVGAALCAGVLALYNTAAFGNPLALGYFHETEAGFRAVYSEQNPIGLTRPSMSSAIQILWSPRGLILVAPVTLLALAGAAALALRREWGILLVAVWSFSSIYLVNASHPTWTGGFATGPRYVLPAVPFLMILVSAALASQWRWPTAVAAGLGVIGFVIVGACTAYGGRLPDIGTPYGENPLLEAVIPAWQEGLFDRNAGKLLLYPWWPDLAPQWRWIAFVPLLAFLFVMIGVLRRRCVHKPLQ